MEWFEFDGNFFLPNKISQERRESFFNLKGCHIKIDLCWNDSETFFCQFFPRKKFDFQIEILTLGYQEGTCKLMSDIPDA